MNEYTRQIFVEFHNAGKLDNGEKKRKELINQFNDLSLDEQYEVLIEAAKTIDYDRDLRGGTTGNYDFFFKFNRNSRIIDILNHKFPNGIKTIGKPGSDYEVEDGMMPSELYCNLLNFFPGYDSYNDLVTKTNIFKDEMGAIDTKKISKYWANPQMDFSYRQMHYKEIFRYLDPDTDRERNN